VVASRVAVAEMADARRTADRGRWLVARASGCALVYALFTRRFSAVPVFFYSVTAMSMSCQCLVLFFHIVASATAMSVEA
jgi:hypothetical protein